MTRIMPRSAGWTAVLALALMACGGNDRYQGLDADALFSTAQSEFDEGEYDNAIDAIERLMVTPEYQSHPRLPEARFLLGRAYFEKEEYITSRAEYQRFLDRYVGHELSPAASLGICRSLSELAPNPQRDQTFTREAMIECGNVVFDYAGTPEALEAAEIRESLRQVLAEKDYLTARHYFRRSQYDPAIIYFQFVVDRYPETPFASQALLGMVRANREIGYDDLAEEARARLLREYPNSAAVAELLEEESES
jgi:outer membrane protein assembly factor BamD